MRISVALCTYNGEKYLPEQLESIKRQTRQPDEMIVCDDGSVDHTWDILQTFRKSSPFPVQVHRNKNNLGSTKNFEKAVRLCNGDIIALSDQDDIWKPHKLERIEDIIRKAPNAGYVFSDADVVDENLNPLGYSLWESAGFQGHFFEMFSRGQQTLCFMKKQFVTGATMAFRASLRDLVIPFPDDAFWVHDYWIAVCLSSCGANGMPISEKLIRYRRHSDQQIGVSPPGKTKSSFKEYLDFPKMKINLWEGWLRWGESCLYLKRSLETVKNDNCDTSGLQLLEQFEMHFSNRKLIHSQKGFSRLKPVLAEMMSGRYGLFSNSWKSAFRDLFLN